MRKYILNIVFIVAISVNSFAHEYFMSVTRGNYNPETQMMECEMKVTAHDLEKAIRVKYAKAFDLDDQAKRYQHDQLLSMYISSKIEVMVNDKYVNLEYIGYELEVNDDLWIYFQFKAPNRTFKYQNKVLTELFAMQQNVTHFKTAECEKSFVFTKNQSTEKFTCNE
ncbi:DUF6702 family protein [Parvicella tangerina]|nr:DUF6702 family protein [Parvicella tangerina]